MKFFPKLKDYLVRLSKKGLTPEEIARGIAVGIFIACIPFYGTHTITAIGAAHLFRLNTLIVILGTQASNPLSLPFQLFVSAEIGSLLLKGKFLDVTYPASAGLLEHYILPIIVGSLIFGAASSFLAYLSAKSFLMRRALMKQKGS
ncbi:MAG: DUF2062 domain-containing protein [Nitrospirota bacterium]